MIVLFYLLTMHANLFRVVTIEKIELIRGLFVHTDGPWCSKLLYGSCATETVSTLTEYFHR